MCLLGNQRATFDIDYTTNLDPESERSFEGEINQIAAQLHLDVESVPIEEFIPLPPGASSRRRFIGSYGNIEVYIFDLYTIALSKIARGFEADFNDVSFMLKEKQIYFDELEKYYKIILPEVSKADIAPKDFKEHFNEIMRRIA